MEYAIREKCGLGNPVQRVRILKHTRGSKWQADYVDSSSILVRWRELRAFLTEESAKESLRRRNDKVGWKRDSPLDRAVHCVLESVGDEVSFWKGTLTGSADALERLRVRARYDDPLPSYHGFTDRSGTVHVPFDESVSLAQRFTSVEPLTVLTNIESTERNWTHDADRGEGYLVPLLNEFRAAWALIRQWTGHDPVVAEREAEIQRLERLVWGAVYALQKAGLDRESARLRRAVGRGSS